ncbi:MAG: DNA-processing protein DprA [bacterium]
MTDKPDANEPMSEHRQAMVRDMLALVLVQGVGPVMIRSLLNEFGTASAAIRAGVTRIRQVDHVGPKLAEKIARAGDNPDIEQELKLCREHGVSVLLQSDDDFPEAIRSLNDCPAMLFVKGRIEPIDRLAVGVVGSRRSTHYGRRMAEKLSTSLARSGMTVISGLARGIDEAAHRGALNGGGRTLAVLANGLAQIYPPEMEPLARDIMKNGALISEMPMGHPPMAELFIRRNRIISGLSLGVVVVEAALRSGSLSTARHAMEQNREVFAVPGPADSLTSQGCHRLIRDGAKLVESVTDIIEELRTQVRNIVGEVAEAQQMRLFEMADSDTETGAEPEPERPAGPEAKPVPAQGKPRARKAETPAAANLSPDEQSLLDLIGDEPVPADVLMSKAALPSGRVLALLSLMEMRRLIRRYPGPAYSRY